MTSRGLLCWLIGSFFSMNFAHGNEINVCKSCPVKTIQSAIEMADSGQVICVQKGLYKEHDLTIVKGISIQGEGNPTIDIDQKGYGFKVKANGVTISGIRLINVGQSYTKDYAAIYLSHCENFTITNMELNNVFFGILVEKSHYGIIKGNKVSSSAVKEASSGNGVHMWHSSHIVVEKNELSGLRDGIYFEFVTHSKIIENISHNNLRYGLHFMFSNNDEYHYNEFYENGAGVAVMFSKYINMTHNVFRKNWGSASYGLLLKEIYDAEIAHNTLEENTIGINAEGCTRINYQNNNFIGNGWAVKISGACYSNIFTKNNFLNNSFDVSYNSKLNDNSFNGNYWSEYTGYDLDKNKIGDIPYRPVKLFSYVVNQSPESILLLRSLFVEIINFSEKVSPVFTPDDLIDDSPLMNKVK